MYIITYEIGEYRGCSGGEKFEALPYKNLEDVQYRIDDLCDSYGEFISSINVYSVANKINVKPIKYATAYKIGGPL